MAQIITANDLKKKGVAVRYFGWSGGGGWLSFPPGPRSPGIHTPGWRPTLSRSRSGTVGTDKAPFE